jgi:hypothetical protein
LSSSWPLASRKRARRPGSPVRGSVRKCLEHLLTLVRLRHGQAGRQPQTIARHMEPEFSRRQPTL